MFDDDWDLYGKWEGAEWVREYDCDLPPKLPNCNHEWRPVLLLISTVYDCKKCGIKKEQHDKESSDIPF